MVLRVRRAEVRQVSEEVELMLLADVRSLESEIGRITKQRDDAYLDLREAREAHKAERDELKKHLSEAEDDRDELALQNAGLVARCETLRELADSASAEQGLANRRMMQAQAERSGERLLRDRDLVDAKLAETNEALKTLTACNESLRDLFSKLRANGRCDK
jgi:hypothetical protein